MLKIKNYVKAESLEQAYELNQNLDTNTMKSPITIKYTLKGRSP